MGKPKTVDCCTKYCMALLAISNHTDHCEHVGPWQVSFSKGGHNKQNQLNNVIYGKNTHLENSQFRTLVLLFGPWWQFLIDSSAVPSLLRVCSRYKPACHSFAAFFLVEGFVVFQAKTNYGGNKLAVPSLLRACSRHKPL